MNKQLREQIVACAKKNGADLVGFASADRFTDGVIQQIFPGVKTVIGIAFRVLRGSYRGVEEGTTYYQYTTTGVETIEETLMPGALLRLCACLEEIGRAHV